MKIIAVTDRLRCIRNFEEQIEIVARSGVDMIVLREKDMNVEDYSVLARRILAVCGMHDVELCIAHFTKVAEELGIGTVWITYADLVEHGRPSFEKVGVSIHSETEAYDASDRGADFIVYGNIFETTCKPGKEGRGFDEIRMICVNSDIPVYAIGGINTGNLQQVHDCMVDGVCMMSGFMQAEDPSTIIEKARSLLD